MNRITNVLSMDNAGPDGAIVGCYNFTEAKTCTFSESWDWNAISGLWECATQLEIAHFSDCAERNSIYTTAPSRFPRKHSNASRVRMGIDWPPELHRSWSIGRSHKHNLEQNCVCANDLYFKICVVQVVKSPQPSRPLVLLLSSCENAVKAGSSLKPLKLVRFKRRNLPSDTALSLYDNRIIPIIITDIAGRCNV